MLRAKLSLLLAICLLLPTTVSAQFDERGNYLDADPALNGTIATPGEACGECKDPDLFTWGMTFRNREKWVVDLRRTLYRLDDCRQVEEIPLPGIPLPAGLGYDSKRDFLIVTDASLNTVTQMSPSGRAVRQWPTPGPGPVGAAYDSRRDLYWFSDWELDVLYSVDPNTGLPGPSMSVPAGSRISGTAYDAVLDALVYHGRNEALTYWVSVETGEVLGIYMVPNGGRNNGAGAGIDPESGNLWLSHNEDSRLFCLRGLNDGNTSRVGTGRHDRRLARFSAEGPVLGAASPNPFNPVTRIRYVLPNPTFAELSIFDVRGRLVETLVSRQQSGGEHIVEWYARNVPSGIYFYCLAAGNISQTRKVILLK